MHLTSASRYAVQALVHLARQPPGAWGRARDIAGAEGLPDTFLGKVLAQLVKAGLARSVKGPNGGYSLARAPAEITLLDIIEAVDGPIRGEPAGVSAGGATALDRRLQAGATGRPSCCASGWRK
jgi:Rrf2 family transcriptional regulator, iron-sulfur cluster assembly transcription factor